MRLFIAIDLDDAARHSIASLQTRLKAVVSGERSALKWIRPEHMHLTLAFLGELEEGLARSVVEAIGQPVQAERFPIVFGGLGLFPSAGAPRVLWLGLTAGARDVIGVQREIAARVTRLGIALERRPFQPHLTLARWRTSRQSDRQRLATADWTHDVARIEVHEVSLIHSRLTAAGPVYTPLSRGLLAPGPASRGRLGDSVGPPLQSS
jgi:2'-5' RNA ligase